MPEFRSREDYENWKAEKLKTKIVQKKDENLKETKQKTVTNNLQADFQYCPQCGTENIDKAILCIKCGSPLSAAKSSPSGNISHNKKSSPITIRGALKEPVIFQLN